MTAPLLGPTGAAAVFGAQKGANAAQIAELEQRLLVQASLVDADPDTPGAGAAGGTAFGFLAAWNATITPGAPTIAALTGLDRVLARADVLITGEGAVDATSSRGKVVGHALQLAAEAGVDRAVVIGGRVDVSPQGAAGLAVASVSLTSLAGSTEAALAEPARWLRLAGRRAADSVDDEGFYDEAWDSKNS